MLRPSLRLAAILAIPLFLASFFAAQDSRAQVSPTPPSALALLKPSYPDSTSGLEHLVKDIIKAQSENDGAGAEALLKTLVLPNPYNWYDHVFGREAADHAGEYYEKAAASIPPSLARTFLDTRQKNFQQIRAIRYEHSCDDNAPEAAYGMLLRRHEPIPLYELRFVQGNQFIRVFPLAFVDGSFRFLLDPEYQSPAPPKDASDSRSDAKSTRPDSPPSTLRVAVGGSVQAAKLIHRVQPIYPEKARLERVSGTVKIHVVIGTDGQLSRIGAVHGICSLAESAVDAVRQWRFSPTLVNGQPVEVDTEINVVFSLSR